MQGVVMDLYADLLTTERRRDKHQKETQELLRIIRSLQKRNEKEKEDLLASHELRIHQLMANHEEEVKQACEKVQKVALKSILTNEEFFKNFRK